MSVKKLNCQDTIYNYKQNIYPIDPLTKAPIEDRIVCLFPCMDRMSETSAKCRFLANPGDEVTDQSCLTCQKPVQRYFVDEQLKNACDAQFKLFTENCDLLLKLTDAQLNQLSIANNSINFEKLFSPNDYTTQTCTREIDYYTGPHCNGHILNQNGITLKCIDPNAILSEITVYQAYTQGERFTYNNLPQLKLTFNLSSFLQSNTHTDFEIAFYKHFDQVNYVANLEFTGNQGTCTIYSITIKNKGLLGLVFSPTYTDKSKEVFKYFKRFIQMTAADFGKCESLLTAKDYTS